jgi:hypothetical protein
MPEESMSHSAVVFYIFLTFTSRHIQTEGVYVGDQHGIQGQFQQSVEQALGLVLGTQSIDLHLADFKCLGNSYTNTPDVIMMNNNNELKVGIQLLCRINPAGSSDFASCFCEAMFALSCYPRKFTRVDFQHSATISLVGELLGMYNSQDNHDQKL